MELEEEWALDVNRALHTPWAVGMDVSSHTAVHEFLELGMELHVELDVVLDVVPDAKKVLKIAFEDMGRALDLSMVWGVDTDAEQEVGDVAGIALDLGRDAVASRTFGGDVAVLVVLALDSGYPRMVVGHSSGSVL